MSAPAVRSRSKLQVVYQEVIKVKEQIEMKSMITKIKTPAIILGGLAIGAVLISATVVSRGAPAVPSHEQRAGDSIQERFEVQRLLADMYDDSSLSIPATSESVQEWLEVQRVLEDMYNHSSISVPTGSESVQERLEVQRVLEDMYSPSSAGLPTLSDSIQERLEVQRVRSDILGQ